MVNEVGESKGRTAKDRGLKVCDGLIHASEVGYLI
jgi:hypothetical protein